MDGELHSLVKLNIKHIDLRAKPTGGEVVDGNRVVARGHYVTNDDMNYDAAAIEFIGNGSGHKFDDTGTLIHSEDGFFYLGDY